MTQHMHNLIMHVPANKMVTCTRCEGRWRLANYDEAIFVQMTDGYLPTGPYECDNGVVVVPLDYSLFMKEDTRANSS